MVVAGGSSIVSCGGVLVLASQSPRRSDLLRTAGFDFIVRARPVEEVLASGRKSRGLRAPAGAREGRGVLGTRWTKSSSARIPSSFSVIGFSKSPPMPLMRAPCSQSLSGRDAHRDHRHLPAPLRRQNRRSRITRVHFAASRPREIEDYVASGEPMDKAGAYAIQGLASKFIDRIEGDYFNVMGLPLALVYRHWKWINTQPT